MSTIKPTATPNASPIALADKANNVKLPEKQGKKRQDKRQEILEQAAQLFQRNGYHATSVRDIAKAVNLKGSSLYTHINSKESLLWEIVANSMQSFVALGQRVPEDVDALEQLAFLIEGHLDILVRELPNASVLFHDWRSLSGEWREKITQQRDQYQQVYRHVIETGIAQGIFRTQDSKAASLFILSALNWSYQWYNPTGIWDVEALAVHYKSYLLPALQ